MTDYVKRKIVEKLARFTKDLKPSDISLSFLSGKGELHNLELNAEFITEVLQLPPWLRVSRVICDSIRAHVPFTSLRSDPVQFGIGLVEIEVSTCNVEEPRQKHGHEDLMDKLSSSTPSKYGFTEKVIDGMKIEIRSIVVKFRDPNFEARLEMNDIVIQSTTPQWKPASLPFTRYKNLDEESVIIYKMCSWNNLKLEGWSTDTEPLEDQSRANQIRLISGESRIRVALKRRIEDCAVIHTRFSVHLGDVVWIVSQSQLRAASRLVQSLMAAALKVAQREREERERDSVGSTESLNTVGEEAGRRKTPKKQHQHSQRVKASNLAKERVYQQRMLEYREGKRNVPPYEVIQDSFHLRTGKIDLQLCDDMTLATDGSQKVESSMLLQLFEVVVDVYFDQPAMSGRYHWNKANDLVVKNANWSRKLVVKASKTQRMELPSVSLQHLHERGVVVRCANFTVETLRSMSSKTALPLITSDKKTFSIPDDVHNPAFQIGITNYHYPKECRKKFLVPRTNVFGYVSPIHVNLHQVSCLWLAEFLHGVVKTINLDLALSVHEEGRTFLEARKAMSVQIPHLPGIDGKFRILYTKITIPIPEVVDDGRPKALQVETAAIRVRNYSLDTLMRDEAFGSAVAGVKNGWVFATQSTEEFPHFERDFSALPARLRKLLDYRVPNTPTTPTASSPMTRQDLELRTVEGWHIHTSCVHVAFAESYTHQATLYTREFVKDFPVHAWMFLQNESDPTPPDENDPTFAFMAYTPNTIQVELERLQLLFLMRMKESFTDFKNSLMRFLTLKSPEKHLQESLRVWEQQRRNSELETEASGEEDGGRETPTDESHQIRQFLEGDFSASIGGCVIMRSVEANILLPSLYAAQRAKGSSLPKVDSEASTPTSLSEVPRLLPTMVTSPSSPSYITYSRMSRSSSQTSLTSEISLPVSGLSSSSSVTSLPLMQESPLTATHNTSNTPEVQLHLHSHGRSLSTSNIRVGSETGFSTPEVIIERTPSPAFIGSGIVFSATRKHEELTTAGLGSKASSLHSSTSELRKSEDSDDSFVMVAGLESSTGEGNYTPQPSESSTASLPQPVQAGTASLPQPVQAGVLELVTPNLQAGEEAGGEAPKPETQLLEPSTPSISSRRASTVSGASRRVKSPTPLQNVPKYILQISMEHISALPNIKAKEISAKACVQKVGLKEVLTKEYEATKNDYRRPRRREGEEEGEEIGEGENPAIKARIEVGDHVMRFYPSSETVETVVMVKVDGLETSLLLQNAMIMKDFFEDEFESDSPVPLQIRVENTKILLRENLEHGPEVRTSVTVLMDGADINRGRKIEGINLFPTRQDISQLEDDIESESHDRSQSNAELLQSFRAFIETFESHVKQHGELQLSVPQPEMVTGLLNELRFTLTDDPTTPTNLDFPPSYSEVVYTTSGSMATKTRLPTQRCWAELMRLRRENEELRRVQLEKEELHAELSKSRKAVSELDAELLYVTDECKKAKVELVMHKQVLEKQHYQLEKLLIENAQLKRHNPASIMHY